MTRVEKPQSSEYPAYASAYVDQIPDEGMTLDQLSENFQKIEVAVRSLPPEKWTQPHAEGEWTVQEILVHVMDSERIFSYRALRIARGDTTPLPGFEQNDYVPFSRANGRTLDDIFDEYEAVRRATITLFSSFGDDVWMREGTASNSPLTVRGALFMLAGHELHHLQSIKQNYLES